MEGQITIAEWQQWKEDIRQKLNQTVENFIFIGYRLRQIQDTEAYRTDGFESLNEFAKAEYNLSSSTVSRFMAINARFSVDGKGQDLLPEFKGMAYSKLQEMLTLPEKDYELLTPQSTVKEIKELKEFNHADPIQANITEPELTPLQTCIKDYFSVAGRRKLLNETMEQLTKEDREPAQMEQLADNMNPSGYATHKKGIVYLFLYDYNTGVTAKIMGQQEPRRMTWEELLEEIYDMYKPYMDEQGETWCNVYGPAPEVKEIPGQMDITQVEKRTERPGKTQPPDKKEKKPEKTNPDPETGMTEEEKEILEAAVEHVLNTNHWIRSLAERTMDNIRIALLKEPSEKDFVAGQGGYHLRFPYGKILLKKAEDDSIVFSWGVSFFCGEIQKELQKLPLPELEPVEGEYREIQEEPEEQESQETEQIATSQGKSDEEEENQETNEAADIKTYEELRAKAEMETSLMNFCFQQHTSLEIPIEDLRSQLEKAKEVTKILSEMILLREAEDGEEHNA